MVQLSVNVVGRREALHVPGANQVELVVNSNRTVVTTLADVDFSGCIVARKFGAGVFAICKFH